MTASLGTTTITSTGMVTKTTTTGMVTVPGC
jgi:hypothetical protein